jgi:hypothetical protein
MQHTIYVIDKTSRQHSYHLPTQGIMLTVGGSSYTITGGEFHLDKFMAAIAEKTPFILAGSGWSTVFNPENLVGIQTVSMPDPEPEPEPEPEVEVVEGSIVTPE